MERGEKKEERRTSEDLSKMHVNKNNKNKE